MAKNVAIVLLVLLLLPPAVGFFVWLTVGGGAWLGNVEVLEVSRSETGEVFLLVNSCNANPRPSQIETVDGGVILQVEAFSTPLFGGSDCADQIGLGLLPQATESTLTDLTSGEEFEIPSLN